MNSALGKQTPANKKKHPCIPNKSLRSGKHFKMMNENDDNRVIQNETPNSLMLAGINSAITMYGKDEMPHVDRKTMDEKLTIGIQLNA